MSQDNRFYANINDIAANNNSQRAGLGPYKSRFLNDMYAARQLGIPTRNRKYNDIRADIERVLRGVDYRNQKLNNENHMALAQPFRAGNNAGIEAVRIAIAHVRELANAQLPANDEMQRRIDAVVHELDADMMNGVLDGATVEEVDRLGAEMEANVPPLGNALRELAQASYDLMNA